MNGTPDNCSTAHCYVGCEGDPVNQPKNMKVVATSISTTIPARLGRVPRGARRHRLRRPFGIAI
jgi:hypothetical protein